ncbi:extracellular solute-binding protein [Paenibacillus sp. MCAF20]
MDNKWRRRGWYKLLLLLVLVFILLSGCASHNENITRQESSPPGVTDRITIRIAQSLPNDVRTKSLQTLIEAFERQHPSIKVELVSTDYATADKTIMKLLGEEQRIDIVEVRTGNLQSLVSEGLIENLQPYVAQWDQYSMLSENARTAATSLDGTPYYIPSGLYQSQLYYRKDLFEAKALQVPETWEQLYFVGKQLTSAPRNQFGYAFRGGTGATRMLNQIIQAYNSDDVNLGDPMYRHDGKSIFADDGALQAIELYRNIYADTSPPESINWGFNEQVEAFIYNNVDDSEFFKTGAFAPYILMNNNPVRYAGTRTLGGFAQNGDYTQNGPDMLRKYLRGDWTGEHLLEKLDEMWERSPE